MSPLVLWSDCEYTDGYVRTLVSEDGILYQLHFFDGSNGYPCEHHILTSVDGCEYV